MIRFASFHPILFYVALAVLAIIPAVGSSAEPATQQPAADAATAELNIKGTLIEKLVLVNKSNRVFEIERPPSTLSLASGQYYVREVHLEGGYFGYGLPATDENWFTLAPEQPYELNIGAPLTLNVKTSRLFRTLTLDYELNDASGRKYSDRERSELPKFTVYRGDREIASGSFEYG
jgi:hypothetical protein